ncbi:MAG: LON peptidase substrate-binding domain-containing protein [Pirellulales bacterium]
MAFVDEPSFGTEKFSGVARLFPLPNLVVFPHVMQPLHVFEPRYRALLEEALGDDGLIALAILAPGWEKNYEGRPSVRPNACLCKIATHHRTSDGNYNVLLLGVKRIEIVRELPPAKSFREAEVRLCHDDYPEDAAVARASQQRRLLDLFKQSLPKLAETTEGLDQVLGKHVPLGMLTDIVAYTLDLGLDRKEQLLAETNVDRRVEILFEYLSAAATGEEPLTFPPPFSDN